MSRLNFSKRFQEIRERDRRFIAGMDVGLLNKVLVPLYVAFICLNFLDVYSTLLAMHSGFQFKELNPIAATLFDLQFSGFTVAILFKYLPAIPLFYAVFVGDSAERHSLEIRMVKFTALVALVGADAFLVYVVGINNIPTLIRAFANAG